jgi:urea carboxylase
VWKSWGRWSHEEQAIPSGGSQPWLLRFFDRIRFYPVSADALLTLRAGAGDAGYGIRTEPSVFDWSAYQAFLSQQAQSIQTFRERQRAAFAAERGRWEEQLQVIAPV